MEDTKYCKECGKMITYVHTEAGKWMPCELPRVDFAEDPTGTDRVYLGNRQAAVGYILTEPTEDSVKAYRPHWGQCPGSASARRRPIPARKPAESKTINRKPAALKPEPAEATTDPWEQMSMYPPERQRLKDHYAAIGT